jgi:hypothetical protein
MIRRLIPVLVAGAALGGPPPAAAQNLYFIHETTYGFGVDTAFAVPVGGTRKLYLYANVPGGVSSYSVTVFFDTTSFRVVRADSVPGYGMPSPSVTSIINGVTLSATGTGTSGGLYVANLELEAKATAPTGSLLSIRVNQWLSQAGAQAAHTNLRTDLMNACLARVLWGDPDSSRTITGRDALIALTSAVGLPVTGFDLTVADVDDDLAVTSRDALLMLSYAVGGTIYYYYYERTGIPKAGPCAPLAGVPSAMVFIRDDATNGTLYRVAAGDTVAVPVGSPTRFGDVPHFARWSPDGSKILGTAYVPAQNYYYDLIAVDVATLAEDTLARLPNYDGGGTYSPDGSRIAFFSDRSANYLWLMDANGANPVQAQSSYVVTNYTATNPAWSPNGQRIAFTGYPVGAGTSGLVSLRVDSGTVRDEFPRSASYSPLHPSWSPAGDSLVFQASSRIYKISAPDTATVPVEAVSVSGTLNLPSWTAAGIVFRRNQGASTPTTYDYYVRRPDGRILRIFRADGTADVGASFR